MKKTILLLLLLLSSGSLLAHPMPASVVNLSVLDKFIKGETKMPLQELESAVKRPITDVTAPFFKQYFAQHIRAVSGGKQWRTVIGYIHLASTQDPTVGKYTQVVVNFELLPDVADDIRKFTFDYDVIMHQVITHSALVLLQQDWDNGIHDETSARVLGIIKLDVPTGKIYPLEVNLEKGSSWKGFASMLNLGMQHIKEGTDHLLFLIVLLLPAMLIANKKNKQWGGFGGIKYSAKNLLRIVTAFTVGHSVTLLLGALGLINVPGQPVELLIAASILVSALHAIRPIFPGRELFVAAGFGLIHGMAFASVLTNLDLSARTLALSILGFNLGIELMQLFIILLIVPWLILLAQTTIYPLFKFIAATLAGAAAVGWIIQRVTGRANFATIVMDQVTPHAIWLIMALALAACLISWKQDILKQKITLHN